MRNNSIAKSLVAALAVLNSTAMAEVVTHQMPAQSKPAGEWGQSWQHKSLSVTPRCAVVSHIGAVYKMIPTNANDAYRLSTVESLSETDVNVTLDINRPVVPDEATAAVPPTSIPINPCEQSLDTVAKCFQANCLLELNEKDWTLYKYIPTHKAPEKIASGAPDQSNQYFNWIQSKLGYDGIILERDNNFYLTLIPAATHPADLQALTIENSANSPIVDAKTGKGSSVMQLIQQEGRFAVFAVVLANADAPALPVGTKLLLEKSKK